MPVEEASRHALIVLRSLKESSISTEWVSADVELGLIVVCHWLYSPASTYFKSVECLRGSPHAIVNALWGW